MRIRQLRPSYANYGVNNPFNLWLHLKGASGELDSLKFKFTVMDIDAVITRSVGNIQYWMICEFKMIGCDEFSWAQQENYKILLSAIKPIVEVDVFGRRCCCIFMGFHVIRANNRDIDKATEIWIDHRRVTHKELLDFVLFEAPSDWYLHSPPANNPRNDEYPVQIITNNYGQLCWDWNSNLRNVED
jgi:hypothetical protein